MKFDYLPEGTIIVGGSSSHCNACGLECFPHEVTHHTAAGYGGAAGPGCGIVFTHITTGYVGREEATASIRPDLEFVGITPESAA